MDIVDTVSKMTLREKASMCSGADYWHLCSIERLGVPGIMVSDGPHGLRRQDDSADKIKINESIKAVCLPTGSALASSFDRRLLYKVGDLLGNECAAEDVSVLLGPAVNIKRSPLCGRNFEYLSEDPYLAGELGAKYVEGVQDNGVGVSLKHFAANNQEKRRCSVSAVIDERALREIYLKAFEKIVRNAHPWTVMCSYNKINGKYSSENPWLTDKVLREEWGFDGCVMTDWGAANDRIEGIKAGVELEMPCSGGINTEKLIKAVSDGRLDEKILDRAVGRILKTIEKCEAGRKRGGSFDRRRDHAEARKIAGQCMVLLKNDGVLPLRREQNIAFIGQLARKPHYQGGGSSHINAYKVYSAYKASERYADVAYADGYRLSQAEPDEALISEAAALAGKSDVAVIFAGLTDKMESEGCDRTCMSLPRCQNRLISEVARVQKNTVVVLHNGSPVTMPWLDEVNAVLEAYLGGEAGAEAENDILFGAVNPSGKLAETFPAALSDTPSYENFPGGMLTAEYRESIYVGYRYYDRMNMEVLFPFGHGLSYTEFEYSGLQVRRKGQPASDAQERCDLREGRIEASFYVENTGGMDGAEAPQLYIARKGESKVFRAPKELKGFDKVFLRRGEKKKVSVILDEESFEFYNAAEHCFNVEDGRYSILVGASSRDIRLEADIDISGLGRPMTVPPYNKSELLTYFEGNPAYVRRKEFARLCGFELPEPEQGKGVTFNISSTLEQAQHTVFGKIISGAVGLVLMGRETPGSPGMITADITERPINQLVAMSGGILTMEMGEAVVDLLNCRNVAHALAVLAKGGINLAFSGKKHLPLMY